MRMHNILSSQPLGLMIAIQFGGILGDGKVGQSRRGRALSQTGTGGVNILMPAQQKHGIIRRLPISGCSKLKRGLEESPIGRLSGAAFPVDKWARLDSLASGEP